MVRYHEVVVDGPRGLVFGFVLGYLTGGGHGGAVYDAEAEGFDAAPLRERIREVLRPGSETVHLLVPSGLLTEVRTAIEAACRAGRQVSILAERGVEARFRFSFVIASREHAERIRGMLETPGGGLRLSGDSGFQERSDPLAQGSEAYAPAHEYEVRGRGAVEGPVDSLLALYGACRDEELIQVGRPSLIDAPG